MLTVLKAVSSLHSFDSLSTSSPTAPLRFRRRPLLLELLLLLFSLLLTMLMLFPKPAPEIMMSIMAVNMKVKLMLIMRVPRVKKAKMPVLLLPQSSTTFQSKLESHFATFSEKPFFESVSSSFSSCDHNRQVNQLDHCSRSCSL